MIKSETAGVTGTLGSPPAYVEESFTATVITEQGLAKIGAKKQREIISPAVLKRWPSSLVTGPIWVYSIIPSDSSEAGAISIGSVQYGCWPKYL